MRLKKEIAEFLRGERNAVRDEFILSRERVRNSERIRLSVVEDQEELIPLYDTWSKKCKRIQLSSALEAEPQKAPKHTGGKRPYIMVMQDRDIDGLSIEARGFLFTIFYKNNIEWHTGRLINRRTKKSLTSTAISKDFNIKSADLKAILNELKKAKILAFDNKQKAYFVSQDFAKKGVPK